MIGLMGEADSEEDLVAAFAIFDKYDEGFSELSEVLYKAIAEANNSIC